MLPYHDNDHMVLLTLYRSLTHLCVIIRYTRKRRMTHLGVIRNKRNLTFPDTTNLEQLLLLQESCSNVRAFTQRAYPVFSSPAERTIKRYRADTVFLDKSSRPHLRARVYTKQRESTAILQSYRVTAVD